MLEWFRDLFFGKKKEQPPVVDRPAVVPGAIPEPVVVVKVEPAVVNTQITDAVTTAPIAAVGMTGSLAATSMAAAAAVKPKRKYTKKTKAKKKV